MVSDLRQLIAFVRTQLDDEERVAIRCDRLGGAGWIAVGMQSGRWEVVAPGRVVATDVSQWEAGHIVGWSPKRALAEVEIKRRILDLAVSEEWDENLTEVVRQLAQPYAERDEWQAEWWIGP